jgi:hypothetical protein
MSSELVPDLINGLVALGTLALAGATVFVGRSAVRATVDTASPRVFVSRLLVEPEPRNWPITANVEPGTIAPGLAWSMTQHGRDRIGLEAHGRFRNESPVSALFRFECASGVQVGQVVEGHGQVRPSALRQERWYVAPPSSEMNFTIIWWRQASVWAEAWPKSVSGAMAESAPVTTVQLVVRGATGDAEDWCDLTFGRYVVVPSPREDGCVIAIIDTPWKGVPGTTPEPITQIGLMRRSYRGVFRIGNVASIFAYSRRE